jgi:hypothetical protein
MLPLLRMGVQGPLYQLSSNKMQHLQGTIILEPNFIHIYVIKYTFFVLKYFKFFILYNCLKIDKSE